MAALGINVDREGKSSPADVAGLGATWIRLVAMAGHDLTDYLLRCEDHGLRVLLVLARESFADGGTVALYKERYGDLVDCVQPMNEPDGLGHSSWQMTGPEVVALGKSVRVAWPDIPIVAPGLVSGQPSWLDGLDTSWADAISVHPYGKSPSKTWPHPGWGTGYMGDLLDAYKPYAGDRPMMVTEVGLGTHEVTEEFQAEYLERCLDYLNKRDDIAVAMWFNYQDFPE